MKIIQTDNAPNPIGPYSQAIEKDGFLFLSGQIGLKNGQLQDKGIETETLQVLENIKAILQEAGYDTHHILKVSIFLTDLNDFEIVNNFYDNFLEGHQPARETIGVASLPLNAKIEISVTAKK